MVTSCPKALLPAKKTTKVITNSSKTLWVESVIYFVILLPKLDIQTAPPDNLTLILQLDRLFDDPREMLIFQELHFQGQGRGVIIGPDPHAGLEDRFPMVILFIHIMARGPCFLV